jgi:alkanesulfonate monooxygenase SsuD/methylene tetrahydromethanopterin reductase-like flavin-dependent oxidoreductase (luciferase family)
VYAPRDSTKGFPYVRVDGYDGTLTVDDITGHALWVWSIRSGEGVIPIPDEARTHVWTEPERELVADRVDTQCVGSPAQVADELAILRDATGTDELIITTITHDHADRVRSYRLLAQEWGRR